MVEVAPKGGTGHTRLRLLDGLRLLAAVSVLLFHFTARASTSWGSAPHDVFPALEPFTAYGALGVQLFFMISGFVVLMSAWGRSSAAFVGSRIGRIYPAYWFAVVVTAVMLYLARPVIPGGSWDSVKLPGVLVNLTMFQQPFRVAHVDGVYWTLWEEMKFYLVIFIMTIVGITLRRVFVVAILWPIAALLISVLQIPVLGAFVDVNTAAYFALGMLLYIYYQRGFSAALALGIGLQFVLIWINIHTFIIPLFDRYLYSKMNAVVVMALCIAMAAAIVVATRTRLASISWKWLTVAGAITYPLYLLHDDWGLWLIGVLRNSMPPLVLVAVLLALFLVVGYLVSRFIERPFGPRLVRVVRQALTPLEDRLRGLRARPTSAGAPTKHAAPRRPTPETLPVHRARHRSN